MSETARGIARQWVLERWPVGLPSPDDFRLEETKIAEPAAGEVLVRNTYLSVDPYMRGLLRPGPSYVSSLRVGEPLEGGAVGVVEQSRNDALPEGTHVLSSRGFRDRFVDDGSGLLRFDPGSLSPSLWLGVLGMPGRTAWVGLFEIGEPREGETVYVSAAAGAVGATVCQIARLRGLQVVGSAGSPEKLAWLSSVARVERVFNYREHDDLAAELARQCPDGIDVYFDNVGGDHLEAALANMNRFGRIVACGMISRYNDVEPEPGPRNLMLIVGRRLRMQGFIVSDHGDVAERFEAEMKRWIANDEIRWRETVMEGLERAPDALIGLFGGRNTGKMLVRLSDS